MSKRTKKETQAGKLRIGDDWNAISIIALSQTNPLKAVAEFVENSIDAGATRITIVRGKMGGKHFLKVTDDGDGILKNSEGVPDFRYVATHICDSVKRRLKAKGTEGLQGEFGIGLLSFWTVGEALYVTSSSVDGKTYQMHMQKGDPTYRLSQRRTLFPDRGTELLITPLLPGIRHFSGEKIQWYLASELRDRIRKSGVDVEVTDRIARKHFKVEPRQFSGQLLHQLPAPETPFGDLYLELYLTDQPEDSQVGLYRRGTRVLDSIASMEAFRHAPWASNALEGIIDAEFLTLTPGTRAGLIQDEAYVALVDALRPIEVTINGVIEAQKQAEEERTSQDMLRTIQKAFREAFLALPAEEYDWFEVHPPTRRPTTSPDDPDASSSPAITVGEPCAAAPAPKQKQFFEYSGPLHTLRISPASCVVAVTSSRTFKAIPRDRSGKLVTQPLDYRWSIVEGSGLLESPDSEIVTFIAPADPGLMRIQLVATEGDIRCEAETVITVTDSLFTEGGTTKPPRQGLPGYTFEHAPGALWRSRYDDGNNLIVVNNGHRDFVYASRSRALKLRYITRLFTKEMVQRNFPGAPPDQLLERMIELSLYTEENLR